MITFVPGHRYLDPMDEGIFGKNGFTESALVNLFCDSWKAYANDRAAFSGDSVRIEVHGYADKSSKFGPRIYIGPNGSLIHDRNLSIAGVVLYAFQAACPAVGGCIIPGYGEYGIRGNRAVSDGIVLEICNMMCPRDVIGMSLEASRRFVFQSIEMSVTK